LRKRRSSRPVAQECPEASPRGAWPVQDIEHHITDEMDILRNPLAGGFGPPWLGHNSRSTDDRRRRLISSGMAVKLRSPASRGRPGQLRGQGAGRSSSYRHRSRIIPGARRQNIFDACEHGAGLSSVEPEPTQVDVRRSSSLSKKIPDIS
jgi:hypothetical protein